jgi:hypothetical protein
MLSILFWRENPDASEEELSVNFWRHTRTVYNAYCDSDNTQVKTMCLQMKLPASTEKLLGG